MIHTNEEIKKQLYAKHRKMNTTISMPMTFRLSLFGEFYCCQLSDAILNEVYYQMQHFTSHVVRLAKLTDLNVYRFQ